MHRFSSFRELFQSISPDGSIDWRRHKLPLLLFLSLILNLAIAPAVYAVTAGAVTRSTAYAIGLLGLVTLGLAIYLAIVILQPERF